MDIQDQLNRLGEVQPYVVWFPDHPDKAGYNRPCSSKEEALDIQLELVELLAMEGLVFKGKVGRSCVSGTILPVEALCDNLVLRRKRTTPRTKGQVRGRL